MAFEAKRTTPWRCMLPLLAALLTTNATAQGNISPEKVRASFILQMQKFVSVGEPPHPLRSICYFEKPGVPQDESVGQLIAKHVQDHPNDRLPAVKRFEAIRDFSGCDLLYIPSEEEANVDNILATAGNAPMLTVSASKRFIYRGGMIGFTMDNDNRVRMETSLKNVKAKGVRIDAQLLEIMQHVNQ